MWPFQKKTADVTFSSSPVLVPDGLAVYSTDPRIRYLLEFNGSRDKAIQVPAVARGIHSLTVLAGLNLETFNKMNEKRTNRLIDQIDDGAPNIITLTRTMEDLVFDGVAIWEVTETVKGYPVTARHVPKGQWSATTEQHANGDIEYTYYLYGHKVVDNSRVIRFDSPREGLLRVMSSAIRQALALQLTKEGFARNPIPKLLFTPKADADPDKEVIREELQGFMDDRSDNPVAYIGAALDTKEVQMLSPQELQLIESDKNVTLAIANFFDMDPDQVGLSTGDSNTYNNAVDRRIDRRTNQLQWLAQTIEQRLSMPDITPRGYSVRFNFDDFLRVDPKSKAEIAQIEMAMGALTVSEYRMDTGRPPLTMQQSQEINMTKALAAPPVQEPPIKVQASLGESVNFSADESLELDFDDLKFARDVNTNSRTVTVLAVPYGQAAKSGGRKWEFEPGSLKYSDINRVKLLRDHDSTISVGYAIDAQETDTGLVVTFKVPAGPAGDKALADFAGKTHDGVSIGVDFDGSDYTKHPSKPGVNLVQRATLREVSQVAMPAFDDSRAMSVQMARETSALIEGDIQMSDETKNETPDVGKLVAEAVAAAFAAQKPNNDETPIQDNAPVLEVKKDKEVAVTFVNEEPLYRFDGSKGRYEFSSDLIELQKTSDPAVRARVQDFMRAEFAVSTTNASSLNPTIQRPDLYVGQMDIRTPIMDAIFKGAPPNGVTPFSFPKYNSSSTLVSDHTQGTEPTLGAYSVTNQTVTPSALSGKIEVNREAWDQGGNPALSQLIRTEMHRAYNEGLETSAATFLNGLDLTTPAKEVTITTAAADSTLEGLMIDALVTLQGQRGGQYLTDFLMQVDLYKALVKAKDSNGRRLFPALNPQNATGQVARAFASVDINGYVGQYAPALGATGTVAANSYLFDPNKLYAWATAPEDLTFDIQVASVFLGIWGYKAFALRDVNGIRRFIYDPA